MIFYKRKNKNEDLYFPPLPVEMLAGWPGAGMNQIPSLFLKHVEEWGVSKKSKKENPSQTNKNTHKHTKALREIWRARSKNSQQEQNTETKNNVRASKKRWEKIKRKNLSRENYQVYLKAWHSDASVRVKPSAKLYI